MRYRTESKFDSTLDRSLRTGLDSMRKAHVWFQVSISLLGILGCLCILIVCAAMPAEVFDIRTLDGNPIFQFATIASLWGVIVAVANICTLFFQGE